MTEKNIVVTYGNGGNNTLRVSITHGGWEDLTPEEAWDIAERIKGSDWMGTSEIRDYLDNLGNPTAPIVIDTIEQTKTESIPEPTP